MGVDNTVAMRLLDDLRGIVGTPHLLVDDDLVASYCTDWTRRFGSSCFAVTRPGSVAEVSAVVEACQQAGVAVVPQGGNTGLVGGGVPRGGEVVLSTARLDAVTVDEDRGQLVAGAGVTLASLHEACRGTAWRFPLDFGARGRATVGGMVSTNAGGVHAMRHGTMRRRVAGLGAVLADGRRIERMLGLTKDNTGFDLTGLLCGSEGVLGVVTEALLQLVPAVGGATVAWVTVDSIAAATGLSRALSGIEAVEAIELMAPECTDDGRVSLLVESVGGEESTAALGAAVEGSAGVLGTEVATDTSPREALWAKRDGVPARIAREGVPVKLDVAVPPIALDGFLEEVPAVVSRVARGARTWRFGHAADGNIHVNVTGIDPYGLDAERVEEAVLGMAVDCGGTIAAEHGVGVAKARWLGLSRSEAELGAMRAIKEALDPRRILNPGVLGL